MESDENNVGNLKEVQLISQHMLYKRFVLLFN